ncbi:BNR-4 repeat-containing protein [Polaribacter septentrionalilitoris]|uniref:BNR-4 repeat-containing protein n=1 Tax=Polaribacter septentrionalilitoris TaxID=2494657 RepID=UPI001358C407|nr:BNR-4 repeat-containing protein [Polaribacter septentrionalilitoris]
MNIITFNKRNIALCVLLLVCYHSFSQVTFEKEVKITNIGLHFDGSKVGSSAANTGDNAPYDFYFGRNISAHGDCIRTYGKYVFMTWYRGGKGDRHVMLTRYNTETGTSVDIEFPHRHTGFQNKPWIGESHNTIAVTVSPLDGTIHMLYDMHAYSRTRPSNGGLSNDYFRYTYSVKNAASVSDAEFTLDKFVKNSSNGYKHLSLNGGRPGYPDEEYSKYAALTYPQFFTNDLGDIFMYMREGGNNNGAYKFSKYDASTSTWSNFTHFNVLNAKRQSGITHNWGLYGNMKYVNGKIRIGFQRRLANNNDKYQYQNGVYYAYSDNQSGADSWKNHSGESFSLPLYDADKIKVMEPGDYVSTTKANQVYIVGSFDWTVTQNGDVHIISKVRDKDNNVTKYLHTYKPSGASDFITSEDFAGGTSIYTAGNDVYFIGLKNGRIFIQKTKGGTNNFETVYQANSGRKFDHGRVQIANGKLYYYLMEKKSGNAQPLYLQIVDLGIIKEPFRVSLTSPVNGQNYYIDRAVQISANAFDENVGIAKVEFRVNGTSIDEDTTKPYTISWTPTSEGAYTIQAVAYNNSNETVSSSEITINAQNFDSTDINGKVFRLKNVATGKYLKSSGSNVEESDYVANDDSLHWKFVKTNIGDTEYYNIDSEVNGVLRGGGSGVGNTIISTGRPSPNSDVDKVWTSNYIETEDVYRFNVKDGNNFLYHQNDDKFYNIVANINDARSKWILELANEAPLSIDDEKIESYSVDIYPNPAKNNFTLSFQGLTNVDIKIYNILGKKVYQNKTSKQSILIDNNNKFKSGIYLVRIVGDNQKVIHKKLIID